MVLLALSAAVSMACNTDERPLSVKTIDGSADSGSPHDEDALPHDPALDDRDGSTTGDGNPAHNDPDSRLTEADRSVGPVGDESIGSGHEQVVSGLDASLAADNAWVDGTLGPDASLAESGTTDATVQAGDGGDAYSLRDSCVLLLHMDEAAWTGSSNEVRDDSGLGNHGTSSSTGATTTVDGKFGRAGLFDGNGFVTIRDAASLHPSSALTLAAWINPTTFDGRSQGIIAKRTEYLKNTAFQLSLWTSNALTVDIQGEDNRFHSNMEFTSEQWYHVAVVFDGSLPAAERVRVYVDGVLDVVAKEDSLSIDPYAPDVVIGYLNGGGGGFVGRIDEVAIWTRALSAANIQALYRATDPL
jgi:hypothetical protein